MLGFASIGTEVSILGCDVWAWVDRAPNGPKKKPNNVVATSVLLAHTHHFFCVRLVYRIALLEPVGRLLRECGELGLERRAILLRGGEVGLADYLPLGLCILVALGRRLHIGARGSRERIALQLLKQSDGIVG